MARVCFPGGRPLQLIAIDARENTVVVNESALREFEESLQASGVQKLAVVSVTGAYRTGKSLLLDLFLRILRYEEGACNGTGSAPPLAFRADGRETVPPWSAMPGMLEGSSPALSDGFRFVGGMDACTQGIWVWSKPFLRNAGGQQVGVVLMDTQGTFDSTLTRAQSATIFGLARLLSSRHIYNVQQQIQQDYLQNLSYFLNVVRAVARNLMGRGPGAELAGTKMFQSLDFVVRDWKHFHPGWTMEQCKEQMVNHLAHHTDPRRVRVKDAADVLQEMVCHTGCWCLPHPGPAVADAAWSGDIGAMNSSFLNFVDAYAKDAFGEDLSSKTTFGLELSPSSFGPVLRNYVGAFRTCELAATSLTQAVSSSVSLLAKEHALSRYSSRMEQEIRRSGSGLTDAALEDVHRRVLEDTRAEFRQNVFMCSAAAIWETWSNIEASIPVMKVRFVEMNRLQHERALLHLVPFVISALILFVLSRLVDVTLVWWTPSARHVSNILAAGLLMIVMYMSGVACLLYMECGFLSLCLALITLCNGVLKQAATIVHRLHMCVTFPRSRVSPSRPATPTIDSAVAANWNTPNMTGAPRMRISTNEHHIETCRQPVSRTGTSGNVPRVETRQQPLSGKRTFEDDMPVYTGTSSSMNSASSSTGVPKRRRQ